MSKIEVAANFKKMKILFRCDKCGSLCVLKHPALNTSVLLIVGGPFVFAPAFYVFWATLPASLGMAHALIAGLGAALITYLAVLTLGRFTQKYLLVSDGAA